MKSLRAVLLLAVISLINAANAANADNADNAANPNVGNILCLMGAASETGQLRSLELFKYLADRGHKLTILGEAGYVTKVLAGTKVENVRYINIPIHGSEVPKNYGTKQTTLFRAYHNMIMWYDRLLPICNDILSSEGFMTVLNMSIEKKGERLFDLIVYDVINAPPCMLSLAQAFPTTPEMKEVPLVGLNLEAKIVPAIFEQARGGGINPASVPHFMSEFDEDMSYFQRCYNLVLYIFSYMIRHWILSSKISKLTDRYLYLRNAFFYLDYESILQRIKLIIVNTHPVFNYAQPLPPNVIEVSGWHITDAQPLPSEVLTFIGRNSSRGIIFISLGCNYLIDDPKEQKRTKDILAVIKRMPEFVFLWKVKNGRSIRKRPKNLYMSEHLSENDVLAFRRTRIYFTDADGLKLQEAMYNGVPVVAAPLLIDQLSNSKRVYDRRMGLRILFDDAVEENLHGALAHILANYGPFKYNAQLKQIAFRNRPYPPLQMVAWWMEQILKTHEIYNCLVSQTGGKLNYFVLQSWDVIAMILVIFLMWTWIFYVASSGMVWYLAYGGGRYYMVRLIRLVWHDFLQEEVQLQVIQQLKEQELQLQAQLQQELDRKQEDRARARGRGRGRGPRRRR